MRPYDPVEDQYENEEEDNLDAPGPDPSDMDSGDEPGLEICPYCRKLINEEAQRCHHCGNYLSEEDAPLSKPAWFVIAVIITLAIVLLVWIF